MHAIEFVILFFKTLRLAGPLGITAATARADRKTKSGTRYMPEQRLLKDREFILGQYCQRGRHKLCALPAQRKLKKATAILPAQDMCLKHEQPIWFLAFVFLLQPV